MLLHGERLYGKVDQVPGLFYVATEFLHIWFIPFAPGKSYVVVQEDSEANRFTAYRIRPSFKSILFAWLRGVLWFACVAGIGLSLEIGSQAWGEDNPAMRARQWKGCAICGSIGAGALVMLWGSYRLARAGPVRAIRLAREAGIPPERVAQYFADRLRDEDIQALEQTPGKIEGAQP